MVKELQQGCAHRVDILFAEAFMISARAEDVAGFLHSTIFL